MVCLILSIVICLFSFSNGADTSDDRKHCNHASLPVFPTDTVIENALKKLSAIPWMNARHLRHSNSTQIPKIIWVNGKDPIKKLSKDHTKMMQFNSKYSYVYIDDEESSLFLNEVFAGTSYLWAYYTLNHMLGAGKADIFRYALLYVFGGVYIDMDTVVYKDLDEYLQSKDGFIVGSAQFKYIPQHCYHQSFYLRNESFNCKAFVDKLPWNDRKITQSLVISGPKHAFIIKTMENLVNVFRELKCNLNKLVFSEKTNPQHKLLCSTGPDLLTASIRQTIYEANKTSNNDFTTTAADLSMRFAGLWFEDLGKMVRVRATHANGDMSPTHWKKLLDNGTSLLSDFEV